jgi:hypothetical protein
MVVSLLSGAVQSGYARSVDHEHAYETDALAVGHALVILWCILYFLRAIVAEFWWRVEGGDGATNRDLQERTYWNGPTHCPRDLREVTMVGEATTM